MYILADLVVTNDIRGWQQEMKLEDMIVSLFRYPPLPKNITTCL